MSKLKRWLSLGLSLSLAAALTLPIHAVDPLANTFAAFLIAAEDTDAPEQNLHVDLFRRDANNNFSVDDSVWYTCNVNRTAGETMFYIQPKTDQVWVEVDYLTDLDGKEGYEMLDGEDVPVNDVLTADSQLVSRSSVVNPAEDPNCALTKDQTYTISAEMLTARGQEAIAARRTAGSGQTLSIDTSADRPILYFISIHYLSPVDQEEYILGYYLSLFDSVIIPSDVAVGSWYYGAVEFALEQGFFSGTGADTFSPNGAVTRGQLAQILWRLGGSEKADPAAFPDVTSSDWFYQAVSWCKQEGLMDGTDAGFNPNGSLTREQLALVLRNYVKNTGADVEKGQSLAHFTDGTSASSWALTGLEWAVGEGLLSGYEDGTLRPGNGIKRAELAAVLRTFCQNYLD